MDLFNTKLRPACVYCGHVESDANGELRCPKKGLVGETFRCRGFRYDPLKRVPPKPLVIARELDSEEFKI